MVKYVNDIPGAPKAVGPYSIVTIANGLAFLSGQICLNPETGKLVEGSIEAQTSQVLKNLSAVLQHIGLSFADVIKTTIFLTDLKNFQTVNTVYEQALKGAKPARATVQVSGLPLGSPVEIEMIAATKE